MNQFDSKKIIALLQQKRIQNYSFAIVFFVIFTFFVIFAIRPNIITAFSLQRELQELRLKDKLYEQQIIKISNYQSLLEGYRDSLPYLDQALPASPYVGASIEVLEKVASESGFQVSNIEVQRVQFQEKEKKEGVKTFRVVVSAQTKFEHVQTFMSKLAEYRRLKNIERIDLSREQFIGGDSNNMNNYRVDVTITSDYL